MEEVEKIVEGLSEEEKKELDKYIKQELLKSYSELFGVYDEHGLQIATAYYPPSEDWIKEIAQEWLKKKGYL